MKGINITARFVLPVLAAIMIAAGLLTFANSAPQNTAQVSASIYRITDAHDRVALPSQYTATRLTDAHDRVAVPRGYATARMTDAHDRAGAVRQYAVVAPAGALSDLSDRHAPEELRAFFSR